MRQWKSASDYLQSELIGRLAVLGIPPEVSEKLSVPQARAIHATVGDWLAEFDEIQPPEPD